MQETSISWADYSLGTVHGCSKVSAGCDHCYAERVSHRFNHTELPWTLENADENISTKEEKLDEPKRVSEGSFIFVNSMSDLFHSKVPEEFIRRHARLARQTPRHIYQILTKRPARAAHMDIDWPENVWIGTSVEDERVVPRIDMLRDVSASTKFVSFEPLIGPVGDVDLTGIDWAIVGGESGPEHREMDHAWAREILDVARRDDVAYFFKQSSARQPERGQALTVERSDGVTVQREFREMPDLPGVTVEARSQQTEQDTLVTDGGTKYSVGSDDREGRTWTRDKRIVLGSWTSKPFMGHRHRHERVEHRLVVEYTHGVGVDILHQARSDDTDKFADDWQAVETMEVREWGMRHERSQNARWLK